MSATSREAIISVGSIGAVTVGGNIMASSTSGVDSRAIGADNNIGSILVYGSLIGNTTNPVKITARGQATPTTTDVAIQSLTVYGSVEYADILAGYTGNTPSDGSAQIGTVNVGGDWIASNLVAGVQIGVDGYFGISDNTLIGTPNPSIIAMISLVDISGQVQGTPSTVNSSDHFGFVAEQFGTFIFHTYALPLMPGPGNDDFPIGDTGDVNVLEVSNAPSPV